MSSNALIDIVETDQEKQQAFRFLWHAIRLENFGKSATQNLTEKCVHSSEIRALIVTFTNGDTL